MAVVSAGEPRPWLASLSELGELAGRVSETEFDALLKLVGQPGRRWFFTGQGRSGLVAAMIAMRLMHVGREAYLVGGTTTPAIRADDGLLVVSGSGATKTTLLQAATAREEGARIASVTRSADGPLVELSDVVLHLPDVPSWQLGASLFDQAALILLDGLVNALSRSLDDADAVLRRLHANLQ